MSTMKFSQVNRNTFMRCFDCKRVMWRKPLLHPRDHLVQHKCVGDRLVTRYFGRKAVSCRNDHPKSEQNPSGGCVIIISMKDYISEKKRNDGRYTAWLELSTPEKLASGMESRKGPVKANHIAKPKQKSKRVTVIRRSTRKRKFHGNCITGIEASKDRSTKWKKKVKRRITKRESKSIVATEIIMPAKLPNLKQRKRRKSVMNVIAKYHKIESSKIKAGIPQNTIKIPAKESKKIEIQKFLKKTMSAVDREVQSAPTQENEKLSKKQQCQSLNSNYCSLRDPSLSAEKSAKGAQPAMLLHESENIRLTEISRTPKPLQISPQTLDESTPALCGLAGSPSSNRSNLTRKALIPDKQIILSLKVSEGKGIPFQVSSVSPIVTIQLEATLSNRNKCLHREPDKKGMKRVVTNWKKAEVLKKWKNRKTESKCGAEHGVNLARQAKIEEKKVLNFVIPTNEQSKRTNTKQVLIKSGSSQNPIQLDSDDDGCPSTIFSTKLAVDQIRIGRFACGRTRYEYPSVQCCDKHFTLHVWEQERNNGDKKEMKIRFEIEIIYSNLTYAAFSRRNRLCFCVFALSSTPTEILDPIQSEESKLLGKFRHDSENIRESSIIITSSLREPIKRIKNLFSKHCPDILDVLSKKERRKLKPKAYLKAHRLWRKSSSRVPFNREYRGFGSSEILVYPKKDSSHGAVTLTMNDVSRLQPGVYLNDNLLDFYLQYLYREKWDESLRQKVYLYNTFFFKKWIGVKQLNGEVNLDFDLRRYCKVKNWTKSVDIFSKDFLVVPVNYELHWSLGIVCFPGAVLDDSKTANRRCCILGFDSLSTFRRAHFNEIKRYLNMAWSDRTKSSVRKLPFTDKRCACIPLQTPSQNNGKDCGVFLLHNCESFFDKGGFPDYTKPSPGPNWYPSSDIPQKRIIIHELISKKCGLDLSKELSKMRRSSCQTQGV